MLKLRRSPVALSQLGHNQGRWLTADYPIAIFRCSTVRGEVWKVAAAHTKDIHVGLAYRAWLKWHALLNQTFDRRRDVLAALEVAVALDPPPTPGRA